MHYVKCFNATKAYQKAYGVDYSTAASIGYRLLEKDGVRTEINRLKQNKLNRVMLSEDDIFQKYMDIAFADITDYVSFQQENVQVMAIYGPVFETDEETGEKKPVMKKVNTVRFKDSDGVDGTLIQEVSQGKDGAKIKLMDRQKALNWLADHMDLATAEQKAKIENLKANTARLQENEDSDDELEIRIIRKETGGAEES
ncbi:terminase small subunit [Emergencia timonensis]|uniref:terminase small subunit n=1 Tax=Emergencia timonensis TaxID=1776384 RepID=UPI00295B56B5|nr:terminase small subunit [Emergencia timonensis]WNX89925.1 terminase small subunit [Emergencia timonensis]